MSFSTSYDILYIGEDEADEKKPQQTEDTTIHHGNAHSASVRTDESHHCRKAYRCTGITYVVSCDILTWLADRLQ